MDNKRTDISQIQKYLNEELDAKAMHRLEREAQDDPFLMEAMEGYEASAPNQQDNLANLSNRLSQRIGKNERRIIPWTMISMAAGVVGFMIVVGLLYKTNQPDKTKQIADNIAPAEKEMLKTPAPAIVDSNTVVLFAPKANAILSAKAYSKQPQRVKSFGYTSNDAPPSPEKETNIGRAEVVVPNKAIGKENIPLDEMVVMGYATTKKPDTVNMPQTVAINKKPMSQNLDAKVNGVTMTERQGKRSDNDVYALGSLAPKLPSGRLLTGTVVSRADGLPIPGVTVKVAGKTTATQTDVNGKFTLPANVDQKETLTFSYLGFDTKKLNLRAQDSLKVELSENSSALSEVVVVSKPRPADDEDIVYVRAHPQNGWGEFKKYLKANALLPVGSKIGTVKVKFIVNPNGSISNITVTKPLTPVADEQAVSIIRNGPGWLANTNGKAETVSVSIKFELKK